MKYLLDMSCTLIHHGHTRLISYARELMTSEDELCICLTTDAEVRHAKGYIPEVPWKYRAELLLSIRGVDSVIPGPWLLTEEYMSENNCDFLIHGHDNSNIISPLKLKVVPRTEGISSSLIRTSSFENEVRKRNKNIFLTPGPGAIHHESLKHIGPCFGRGDPVFEDVYNKVHSWVRTMSEQDELVISQGSSTFSIEMAIKSMPVKEKILIIDSGYYASRLATLAELAGFNEVDVVKDEEKHLIEGNYNWVCGTYVETSVGVKNDIHEYRAIADKVGAKLFLDSTASIGLESGHGVADCIAFSSCKGLLGLTGASFLAFKKDANLLEKTDSWYQSISTHRNRMMTGPYHTLQSLYGIMDNHKDMVKAIVATKKQFMEKVDNSDNHQLVTDSNSEPLICTKIKGISKSLYPEGTIHYAPRVLQDGYSIVCHFSELYND